MASSQRYAEILADAEGTIGADRTIDLSIRWCVTSVVRDADGRPRWADDDEEILRVGGRWDRVSSAWVGEAEQAVVVRIVRGGGQERAARWLAKWFRAFLTGDWRPFPRRLWSMLMLGGRRSGKTHLGIAALVTFAIACPGGIVWAVSPTQPRTLELERNMRSLLPANWYRYRGGGAGKDSTLTLVNGAELLLMSGHSGDTLRQGRVDFALYNEGQAMSHAGYVQIRAPISDVGGLVLIAANPPSEPIGRWVEDYVDGVHADKIDGVHFNLSPDENPWIELSALTSLASEVDEDTYARDVLGVLKPIGDVVLHAWSDRESKRSVPPGLIDITEAENLRTLGVANKPWLIGMDFQAQPHMVAVVYKLFRDPEVPDAILDWIVGAVVVPEADEDDLVDGLGLADRWTPTGYQIGAGFAGDECAVVMDASAWFQDGEHNRGRTSDLKLRARGWRSLFMPQRDSKRNPDLVERVKTANARLKTQDQRRHLFVTPEVTAVAIAFRRWENRNGIPHRRSPYAHICDAATYPLYRRYARPAPPRTAPEVSFFRESDRRRQMRY